MRFWKNCVNTVCFVMRKSFVNRALYSILGRTITKSLPCGSITNMGKSFLRILLRICFVLKAVTASVIVVDKRCWKSFSNTVLLEETCVCKRQLLLRRISDESLLNRCIYFTNYLIINFKMLMKLFAFSQKFLFWWMKHCMLVSWKCFWIKEWEC